MRKKPVRLQVELLEPRNLLSQVPVLAIACGNNSPPTGWSPDSGYYSGSTGTYSTSHTINSADVVNAPPASVLQNERWSSGTLIYTLPNFNSGQTCGIRLDFSENYFKSAGARGVQHRHQRHHGDVRPRRRHIPLHPEPSVCLFLGGSQSSEDGAQRMKSPVSQCQTGDAREAQAPVSQHSKAPWGLGRTARHRR